MFASWIISLYKQIGVGKVKEYTVHLGSFCSIDVSSFFDFIDASTGNAGFKKQSCSAEAKRTKWDPETMRCLAEMKGRKPTKQIGVSLFGQALLISFRFSASSTV